MSDFESLDSTANEKDNNELVRNIANNAESFNVEVVEIGKCSMDGQPIVGGQVDTPHGKAIFDFLKSRASRPISGNILNVSMNGERKSKKFNHYKHAMNSIGKLCNDTEYWSKIPTE